MTPGDLTAWRERNGCSQGILSRIIGVDIMTISRWERDIQKIPPFLEFALRYIEERGDMVRSAIERRADERRAAHERRTGERRQAALAVARDKRSTERRTASRRRQERRKAG